VGFEEELARAVDGTRAIIRGGDMSRQGGAISPSTTATALAELIGRLTVEEKRKLAKVIDWDELQRLRKGERHIGNPRIYVGTTGNGLSLELPLECVPPFIRALPASLSVESVEIFVQDGNGSKEYSLAASELGSWMASHAHVLQEGSIMIEFGSHTLTSGGGGCLSLALDKASRYTLRKIGREALAICGFDHKFKGDEFSALVWEDQLEVSE
jgi:hypothetical protein